MRRREREKDTRKSVKSFVLEDNLSGLSRDGVPFCETLPLVGLMPGMLIRNEFTTPRSGELLNNVTFCTETVELREELKHKLF